MVAAPQANIDSLVEEHLAWGAGVADHRESELFAVHLKTRWAPPGEPNLAPPRTVTRTMFNAAVRLPRAGDRSGNWPSFRGPQAAGIADEQDLPDRWNVRTGENIQWRTSASRARSRSRPHPRCRDYELKIPAGTAHLGILLVRTMNSVFAIGRNR